MAVGKFKCPKCSRTFSMAAHLARHRNAIHGRGKGRKTPAGRMARTAQRKRRAGRPTGILIAARFPSGDGAVRVLREMRAYHHELTSQRAAIDTQIQALEEALGSLSARPAVSRRRGRPRGAAKRARKRTARRGKPVRGRAARPIAASARAGSLGNKIVQVLRQHDSPMGPGDIATAVKAAGYKTQSKDLTKAVRNALPRLKTVKRVKRGLYRA